MKTKLDKPITFLGEIDYSLIFSNICHSYLFSVQIFEVNKYLLNVYMIKAYL